VKKLNRRLSVRMAILKLRLAMGVLCLGYWSNLFSRQCYRLQGQLRDSAVPPGPEEEFVNEPGPIDRYTLDLTAWRGDDGEGLTQFAVTSVQAEQIVAILSDSSGTSDEAIVHSLAEFGAIVGHLETA
jgi:hypothetical protein